MTGPDRNPPSAPPGAQPAFLVVESHRDVHRVPITDERTGIGAAPGNHVTLSAAGIEPLHAEIYARAGVFQLVQRGRAAVRINDRPAAGAQVLTSGDELEIGTARMLFIVPPHDNKTEHKTYIVVRRPDGFVFHFAAQHCRTWVGRTHGDLLVMDDSLAGRHFLVESYGPDAIYVYNDRENAPVQLYGEPLRRAYRRVYNGGVVTAGQTRFAIYGRPREAVVAPPWKGSAGESAPAGAPVYEPKTAPQPAPVAPMEQPRPPVFQAQAPPALPAPPRTDDADTKRTPLDAILEAAGAGSGPYRARPFPGVNPADPLHSAETAYIRVRADGPARPGQLDVDGAFRQGLTVELDSVPAGAVPAPPVLPGNRGRQGQSSPPVVEPPTRVTSGGPSTGSPPPAEPRVVEPPTRVTGGSPVNRPRTTGSLPAVEPPTRVTGSLPAAGGHPGGRAPGRAQGDPPLTVATPLDGVPITQPDPGDALGPVPPFVPAASTPAPKREPMPPAPVERVASPYLGGERPAPPAGNQPAERYRPGAKKAQKPTGLTQELVLRDHEDERYRP